jgi:hypothetical protein
MEKYSADTRIAKREIMRLFAIIGHTDEPTTFKQIVTTLTHELVADFGGRTAPRRGLLYS